jgi:hypothetical protein
MATEIIVTDEFKGWFEGLSELEQEAIVRVVGLLEERGVNLEFPFSSGIKAPSMRQCESYGFSRAAVPTAFCMLSIRRDRLCC